MRKIAVIGSNSFSGQDFIDYVLEDPENKVMGISRSEEVDSVMGAYHRHGRERFEFYKYDLNKDSEAIVELLKEERPEYIVNFAAQSEVAPSWDHPDHWYQTNTVGIINLTNPLRNCEWLKRYVHISSPEVYGTCEGRVTEASPVNPTTPYAASKASGDLFLFTLHKNFNFPLIMIRATNVYGPRQQLFKIIPRSIIYQKMGKMIELHGGGEAVKSYIHIRDVSRGEYQAMLYGESGNIYHLSPDHGYPVKAVVKEVCSALSNDFERVTKVVGERLGQDATYVIDSSKARRAFDWKPEISIKEGIADTVEWINEYWEQISTKNLNYVHKP